MTSWSLSLVWSVTMRSGLPGGVVAGWVDLGSGIRGGTRSARVIESRAPATASRTRTQSRFTVQRVVRSQIVACSGSSLAQSIGAIGPSRARRTSVIVIAAGWSAELVAAVRAAGAHDQPCFAKADDELLQVRARQVLLGGDLRERRRPHAVVTPELDHQAHAVFALRAEGDGAAAVEGEARAGGRRRRSGRRSSIPSDFVGISVGRNLEERQRWAGRRIERCG